MSTKTLILTHALELLEREGPEAVTARRVGAASGLSAMALYRHFKNKDALLEEVGLAAQRYWQGRLARIEADGAIPWLRKAYAEYLAFAVEAPRLFEAAFILRTGAEKVYPEDFQKGRSTAGKIVGDRIREGQRDGSIVEGDPIELGLCFWSQAHGLVRLWLDGRVDMPPEEFRRLYDACCERFLQGALARRP